MGSNTSRTRDKIIEVKQVTIVDQDGKQYHLDPLKITLLDKETNKPLFEEKQ